MWWLIWLHGVVLILSTGTKLAFFIPIPVLKLLLFLGLELELKLRIITFLPKTEVYQEMEVIMELKPFIIIQYLLFR